ncbi:MAG: hypothetical protein ACRD4Q_16495, partial [Candidatus Acidiferrales bacterium]
IFAGLTLLVEPMNNFSRAVRALAYYGFAFGLASSSFGRSHSSVPSAALAVAKAATALDRVPAPDFPADDVPAQARPLLTGLKHSLRALVTSEIDAQPSSGASALQARLMGVLTGAGILHRGQQAKEGYAQVGSVHIAQPPGHPNLLAAVTTLEIPCGEDSSLYVYQRTAHRWQLALAFEANDYRQISGGLGMFEYRISPSDQAGHWFVGIADVAPWCTSNWHALRYQVLRPTNSAYHPRTILATNSFAYRGFGKAYRLAVTDHSFTVVYYTAQSLDYGVLIRTAVDRYSVADDRAVRTGPLALYPEDFLDEWVEAPWQEARLWTAPPARPPAMSWHKTLKEMANAETGWFTSLDFVQACGTHDNWQIGLAPFSNDKTQRVPPEIYFMVARRQGLFRVQSVSLDRPPGCPGQAQPTRPLGSLPDPSMIQ